MAASNSKFCGLVIQTDYEPTSITPCMDKPLEFLYRNN